MKTPRLINSVPDLTLVVTLVLAFALDRYLPVARVISYPASLVGWLVAGIGLVGIAVVISALRTNRTSTNPADMPTYFLTDGLFSISRNPLYLSYIVVVLGVALVLGSLTALLAPLLCFLVIRMAVVPVEEAQLNAGFGSAYRAYCRKVRRWI